MLRKAKLVQNNIFCKKYTHCINHTPLCNTKVCIFHTRCADYTPGTKFYTVLHWIHCMVLHRRCQIITQKSVIFCVHSGKIYTGRKKITRAPLVALVTNIRYGWSGLGLVWSGLDRKSTEHLVGPLMVSLPELDLVERRGSVSFCVFNLQLF